MNVESTESETAAVKTQDGTASSGPTMKGLQQLKSAKGLPVPNLPLPELSASMFNNPTTQVVAMQNQVQLNQEARQSDNGQESTQIAAIDDQSGQGMNDQDGKMSGGRSLSISKTINEFIAISSDIDEDISIDISNDELDDEIDLLVDRDSPKGSSVADVHKVRYRKVVRYMRKIIADFDKQREEWGTQSHEYSSQIAALHQELEACKQQQQQRMQHDSITSNSNSISDNDRGTGNNSPQLSVKSLGKSKDIERILAKCKESLKLKNSQIQDLKNRLSDSKEANEELTRQIEDLKASQETWTVSIAENKQAMHQEIESKNNEINARKREISDLQKKLMDSQKYAEQCKKSLQDIESKLVSSWSTHQKERDNIAKELNQSKAAAIKQLQKEHEFAVERIKLDSEKLAESLKQELLDRDEKIIRYAERQQQLHDKNNQLSAQSDDMKLKIATLEEKLLKQVELANQDCQECNKNKTEHFEEVERYKQEIHQMNARIELLSTANEDQEKAISGLKSERDTFDKLAQNLRSECDELTKRLDSINRHESEVEAEIEQYRNQLKDLKHVQETAHELELKKTSLTEQLRGAQDAMAEKDKMIAQLETDLSTLREKSDEELSRLRAIVTEGNNMSSERDQLKARLDEVSNQLDKNLQEVMIGLLTVMKNLETPLTSPIDNGGCNSMAPSAQEPDQSDRSKISSNPVAILERLASLALDRTQALVAAEQRLSGVLEENSHLAQDINRLRDEINDLNREKSKEVECSMEEAERLRIENQALIHDQKSYDDHITSLETEVQDLTRKLAMRAEEDVETIKDLANEIDELKSSCQTKDEEIGRLQQELQEKERASEDGWLLEDLQNRLEKLEEKYNEAEKLLEAKERELAHLKEDHEKLQQDSANRIASMKDSESRLQSEKSQLLDTIKDLEATAKDIKHNGDNSAVDTAAAPPTNIDGTYQVKALQRLLNQYQEENQRLKESQRGLISQTVKDSGDLGVPNPTEFEYLKNIVHSFMLGKQTTVLARVISAILKFDKEQVEQICRVQESLQSALGQMNR